MDNTKKKRGERKKCRLEMQRLTGMGKGNGKWHKILKYEKMSIEKWMRRGCVPWAGAARRDYNPNTKCLKSPLNDSDNAAIAIRYHRRILQYPTSVTRFLLYLK